MTFKFIKIYQIFQIVKENYFWLNSINDSIKLDDFSYVTEKFVFYANKSILLVDYDVYLEIRYMKERISVFRFHGRWKFHILRKRQTEMLYSVEILKMEFHIKKIPWTTEYRNSVFRFRGRQNPFFLGRRNSVSTENGNGRRNSDERRCAIIRSGNYSTNCSITAIASQPTWCDVVSPCPVFSTQHYKLN